MLDTPTTSTYTVRVFMNTDRDNFLGYQSDHWLCTDADLILTVRARDARDAAQAAYDIGNRVQTDELGHSWPRDVRSVSVGDVMAVRDVADNITMLAVHGVGFTDVQLELDQLWVLPSMADQERVTSR